MEKIDYSEFEAMLMQMKKMTEKNIIRLKEERERVSTEDVIDDMEDFASLESESMHEAALLEQQQHELDEINHALAKIKNGTYGICEERGDRIPLERLRAKPHTRYCFEDEKKNEQ